MILIRLLRHFSDSGPDKSNVAPHLVFAHPPTRALPALLMLLLTPVLLSAAGNGEVEARERYDLLQELKPETLTYTVVAGAVAAPDIPDDRRSVLGGYLRLVRDIAAEIPVRYLTDTERRALAEERLAGERRRIERDIDQRLLQLDRQELQTYSIENRAKPNRAAPNQAQSVRDDKRLKTLRHRIEVLDTLTVSDFALPETVKLKIPGEDTYTFRRNLSDPYGLARERDADLFLYIDVRTLDELYLLTVHLYVPILKTNSEILRIVAAPEEVPLHLERYRRQIVHAVAAAEVSDVTITAVNPAGQPVDNARLYLEGRLIGVGRGRDAYLPAGTYTISGMTPDGRERQRMITVPPGTEKIFPLLFIDEPQGSVEIATTPPGAAVYRGVEWQGVTPLTVPRPLIPTSYTVVHENYYDGRIEIGPETQDRIERVLISREYDWEADTRLSRDRFYRSLGFFAVSVAVPIVLYGTYQDYLGLFPGGTPNRNLSESERTRVYNESTAVYYGYYGSLALSAGFFGNMIWRLVDYIRTAQGYHTR